MNAANALPRTFLSGRSRSWYGSLLEDPGAERLSDPLLPPQSGELSGSEPRSGSPGRDLVFRIQAGDPGAETELAERFGAPLLFLLKRWTRDPETAEDLRQETLRLALEKIRRGEVREPDQLAAFLRSLAKNLSTQLYRRKGERADLREDLDASTSELPEKGPGPLHHLLSQERARLARQVLQEMGSDRDRQILLRFYLGEETAERICGDLDMTREHFYCVLHRARQRYRRLFEELIGAVQ